MKDQYFGDINDYVKYGLLRCFNKAGLSIGVCWMLTRDDGRSDGRKIQYLRNPDRWRAYDPQLFDHLAQALTNQPRSIRRIERSDLLLNASYCPSYVPEDEASRKTWLTNALTTLESADLLFFDPDNGIEVKSRPYGRTGSSKHIYWDEIEAAWAVGRSLLIFQHFTREKRKQYVSRLLEQLSRHTSGRTLAFVSSNVVYLLAYQQAHEANVNLTLATIASDWRDRIVVAKS